MLGRLKMDIEEAITAYYKFVESVFIGTSDEKETRFNLYGSQYDEDLLEEAIKYIIERKTGNKETKLYEEGASCKV